MDQDGGEDVLARIVWYVRRDRSGVRGLSLKHVPVMLFYDITITFGEEVEKIWLRPFTGATILWFLVSGEESTHSVCSDL